MRFEDGSRLKLGREADIEFNQLRFFGDSGMVDTRLRLRKGRVKSEVRDRVGPDGRYEIQTREVTAAVRGTVFVLEQTVNSSRLEVHDGAVALKRLDNETRISAGDGATVTTTEGVVEKVLPRIEGMSISRTGTSAEAPVFAAWAEDPGHGFIRYRIARKGLADNSHSYQLLDTGLSDSNRLRLPASAEGVYQLTLQVVDQQGFNGVPQQFEFRVDSKAPQQFELKLSGGAPGKRIL
ncbi:FecR family protein [Allohahella marinimesophila]|uniref:FecR protein domain-containing protein n=1 Tax=Allohahella marinimesophila TaxID=1054972 RepID=A0ABP7P3H5_9GAMM